MLDDPRHRRTFGHNNPLFSQAAKWDGHRSVRLADADMGLATTAYSYSLSYEELPEAAERIALLWNLHLGVSNAELRMLVANKSTVQQDECCGRPIHDGDPEGYVLACCGNVTSKSKGGAE